MDFHAHKVNETFFKAFLNGNKEILTLNTLQNFFNETIEDFSEKWILILDDKNDSDDFSTLSTSGLYGHKYCILMDYKTNSYFKIGIPNPKDITSIEDRQKSIIIYNGRPISIKEIDAVFQEYLKNNKSSYIVSDLKYILVSTFSLLFQQEKEKYSQTMHSRQDLKECKKNFFEVDFDVDDVFVSYNIDENSIESDKESIFKKLKVLVKIQNVYRKDILLKDHSNQKLIHLINLSLDIFDLMRAINEYIRGDASVYLQWKRSSFRFNQFNSTLLEDFRGDNITEGTLKLVRERISEKIEEINENASQFKELSNNQNTVSYSILRWKKQSDNGFKSFEFRSKEFLYKSQLKIKGISSKTFSLLKKFGKKRVQQCKNLGSKTWVQILIGYVVLSALSGFFKLCSTRLLNFPILLSGYGT